MNAPGQDPDSKQKSGWGDVASLEMRPKTERKPDSFRLGVLPTLWLFICATIIAAAATAVSGSEGAEGMGYALGSFIGTWLISYFIGWVVYRLGGRSVIPGQIAVCIVAALMMLSHAGRFLAHADQSRQEQAAMAKELRGAVSAMSEFATSTEPVPLLKPSAAPAGTSNDVQAFINAHFNKVITQHNEYLAELESVGWTTVLDPDRLEKDAGLVESRAIVARAGATVEKHRQRWLKTLDDAVVQVGKMKTDTATKRGFVAGFRGSVDKGKAEGLKIWELEAEIVATTGKIVQLLSHQREHWSVDSGQFVFDDDQALAQFNTYAQKLDAIIRQEEDMQRANRTRAEQGLRQLEPK